MNPWLALAAFVAWTSAVWYYADQHGAARAGKQHEKAVATAEAAKRAAEGALADSARQYEEDRANDQDRIEELSQELNELGRSKPLPAGCRLGPERLRIWNEAAAGAGAAVSGKPAREVRDPGVSPAEER